MKPRHNKTHFRGGLFLSLLLISATLFTACHDDQTYADRVKRERSAINAYIADSSVNVISEDQFRQQNYTTDANKNQFVLFESSGLYMQIVRKGAGKPIAAGESARVLCRYTERNLLTDSIQLSNTISPYYYRYVEVMNVTNNSGTFSGSFEKATSLMNLAYGTTAIPSGWLAVLPYINIGRFVNPDDEPAKVRLIVPHDLGQTYAFRSVYPCLYDITFERGI
ncbi:DUF4827 domain-containing protein [Hallella multisaccharivorax DSM 17128]|uniref:Putative lipoprotein n=1 Tax=Hallella multisaccharivorax DSM 17128 TaxID=688246 RepID=F8NC71_9BACT|nr:DUF4827 domain-containing protein [Hallella multisaccharivorax]EGN58042.1 putative lipoprotein [Hallella multisaccharivorax DSM 17128]GJG30681.1 DUF4827 domain-containing protein [Hallella multisaccharivorax DSM 17128]